MKLRPGALALLMGTGLILSPVLSGPATAAEPEDYSLTAIGTELVVTGGDLETAENMLVSTGGSSWSTHPNSLLTPDVDARHFVAGGRMVTVDALENSDQSALRVYSSITATPALHLIPGWIPASPERLVPGPEGFVAAGVYYRYGSLNGTALRSANIDTIGHAHAASDLAIYPLSGAEPLAAEISTSTVPPNWTRDDFVFPAVIDDQMSVCKLDLATQGRSCAASIPFARWQPTTSLELAAFPAAAGGYAVLTDTGSVPIRPAGGGTVTSIAGADRLWALVVQDGDLALHEVRADGSTARAGSIPVPAPTSPEAGAAAINRGWRLLDGADGQLGNPTSGVFCGLVGDGCAQRFEGGLMYWTADTGAHAVWGAIGDRYATLGWETSTLGYPTSPEFCGLADDGCAQRFQGGILYWTPATGANPVYGAIGERYAALGWETSQLGYPTSGEFCDLVDGGCFQRYEGGSIYWSPGSGAFPSWGLIREYWGTQGWERGHLGYPVSTEACDTSTGTYQCTQRYQGGTIIWDPAQGARHTP